MPEISETMYIDMDRHRMDYGITTRLTSGNVNTIISSVVVIIRMEVGISTHGAGTNWSMSTSEYHGFMESSSTSESLNKEGSGYNRNNLTSRACQAAEEKD